MHSLTNGAEVALWVLAIETGCHCFMVSGIWLLTNQPILTHQVMVAELWRAILSAEPPAVVKNA